MMFLAVGNSVKFHLVIILRSVVLWLLSDRKGIQPLKQSQEVLR